MVFDEDPELAVFAERLLDLARRDVSDLLAGYVDAGVPVDLATKEGDTLLMLAAYHGHAATAAALIARGADVNKPNNKGQFPLAGAAFAGHVELVAMLIDAGADPARPCRDGGTPLQFAELFGRHSVGTLLRERLGKPPRRGVAGSKTRVVSSGARTSRKTAPKAQAPEETLTQNGATGNQTRETSSKGDPVNDDLKHSDRLADAETTR